jgi:hypothetical protein
MRPRSSPSVKEVLDLYGMPDIETWTKYPFFHELAIFAAPPLLQRFISAASKVSGGSAD